MMLFFIALYYFLSNDNQLTAIEGGILFISLLVFLFFLIKRSRNGNNVENVDGSLAIVSNFKIVFWLILGIVLFFFGSKWLLEVANKLANLLGLTDV